MTPRMQERKRLSAAEVQADLDRLPPGAKTADVDALIRRYVREKADVSALRSEILTAQQFHRIYFYVSLKQIRDVRQRMAFIHENLLFSDWWHTDQLIKFVSGMDFQEALTEAGAYMTAEDPFVRRWGFVMFISPLGHGHAEALLPLMHEDAHYYVQMGEAWLIAELAIFQPEVVYAWMARKPLSYPISGKAIQKISDSFRISQDWKERYRALRQLWKDEQKGQKKAESP